MSMKQIIFAVFNCIFFILGLAVLGIGVYSVVEDGNLRNIMINNDDSIIRAPTLLITAGVLVALIGFFGCIGAWKKNATCLIAYAILVFLIFVLEISAAVYALTQKERVQAEVEAGVYRAIAISYGKPHAGNKALTKAVDWFQKEMKCCGSNKPSDWQKTDWYNSLGKNTSIIVPRSCCVIPMTGCNKGKNIASLGNKIYTRGCIEQGRQFVKDNTGIISKVGVAVGVVQLLGIVCAILLCREFKQYKAL